MVIGRLAVTVAALAGIAGAAEAAGVVLGDDELKAAVKGKTVNIDTPIGIPLNVHYGANGIMNGTAGALAVYLGASKDRGRWWIKGGKLCQKWFKWFDAEPSCLTVRQDGLKIFWRSDEGKTGTAMIDPAPPVLAGQSASGLGLPQAGAAAMPVSAQSQVAAAPAGEQPVWLAPEVKPAPVRQAAVTAAPVPLPSQRQASVIPAAVEPDKAPAPVLLAPPQPVGAHDLTKPASPADQPASAVKLSSLATWGTLRAAGDGVTTDPPEASMRSEPDTENSTRPMRMAADLAAIAAIEHRWCLANALSAHPGGAATMRDGTSSPTADPRALPSLMLVLQEQNSPADLPLHDASCLTEWPALVLVPSQEVASEPDRGSNVRAAVEGVPGPPSSPITVAAR